MKELFKEAHKMAKEIKAEFNEVDYKAQFGLCLAYLLKNEGEKEMVELKGSEKQVKWAEDIRKEVIENVKKSNVEIKNWSEKKENIINALENIKIAKFFINNRNFKQTDKAMHIELLQDEIDLYNEFIEVYNERNEKFINRGKEEINFVEYVTKHF